MFEFYKDISHNNTFLSPRDILTFVDHLIGMKFTKDILDDINHLKNKHLCYVVDLLQDQSELA